MKTNKEMIEEAVANIHKGELLIPEERKEYNTEILTTLLTKHEEAILQKDIERMEMMKKDEVKWKKAKYDVKSVDGVIYNRALNTLIELKRKELEELNKKV